MDFDSIDERQAFKLGFAAYCADQQLSAEDALTFVKKAAGVMENLGLAMVGVPAALGLAGGGALGYGAAKLDEPDITADDIKAKEIAETYQRYTARLKARRAYQKYREARNLQ